MGAEETIFESLLGVYFGSKGSVAVEVVLGIKGRSLDELKKDYHFLGM